LENLKGRDHSKNLGVDGRKTLEEYQGNGVRICGVDASTNLSTRDDEK